MPLLDLPLHLIALTAPAWGLSALLLLVHRVRGPAWVWPWWKPWVFMGAAGSLWLLFALVAFERDGKMLSYAVLALSQAGLLLLLEGLSREQSGRSGR